VSSLGAVPFDMDGWGIDVVATASQKAWMSAPGLAMVAASDRAREAMKTARMPRFYLDLGKHFETMATGETPWTPAVAVAFQVDEGVRLMQAEGQEAVFARHVACAAATQAGIESLGFQLLAEPAHRSRTVTAAWLPDGVEWKDFNARIKQRGVILAGGQGKLAGKVFRVGHLGQVTVTDILDALLAIEDSAIELGRGVERGAAIAAAERAAAGAALQPA
jgi:aspartate aminotransferase-like enzyme